MKRFFLVTSLIFIALILSAIVFVKIYEKRLIDSFKNEIIDKTDLNLDFSDIHFSILKNFPYGSFILENAHVFYSKPSRNDTLVSTKKLCFKINALNLFRNVYDFPEIIMYDGLINIDFDKIDQFIPYSTGEENQSEYIVNTKSIEFVRCKINYIQKKEIRLSMFIDKSKCSGSLLANAISLDLDFNIYRFTADVYGYKYKSDNPILLQSTLNERNKTFYAENASLQIASMNFNLSFLYNLKNDLLQITASSQRVKAKKFLGEFFQNLDFKFTKGDLSLAVLYSINLKKEHSQKLTIKYQLENAELSNIKDLAISKLDGNTSFTGNFKGNSSEINDFKIRFNGIDFHGKSRIKNLPKPIILIDGGLLADGDIAFSKGFSISGKLDGKIKALIKVDDIKNLDLNNLNVKRFNTQITLSDVSIKGMDYLKGLSGNVNIDDNSFLFNGKGSFYNDDFKGTCSFNNFLDVTLRDASIVPALNVDMENLNLNEVLGKEDSNNNTKSNFRLFAKIRTAKYKDADLKDFIVSLKAVKGDYLCDNFSFRAFSGAFTGKFTYTGRDTNSLNVIGQGVNITDLFKGFNNFSQSVITSKNICGTISGKLDMLYKTSSNGKIDPLSIKSSSNLIIENGKLTGVSQLRKVSKFLNLSEVDSIRFKTLQNNIEINNGIIKIPSMEISSNALNFRIAGEHNFNNEFTYWLKINLREILAKKFRTKKDYSSNIESDNKNGLNIFLKLSGNNDSYKVVYDRKSGVEQLKSNLNQEGQLLKTIIRDEFNLSKNKVIEGKDSTSLKNLNNIDSTHNKTQKKPFKIEWDEIDTLKVKNQ